MNIDITPIVEEYNMLIVVLEDVHKVYFRQRIDDTTDELAKLLRIHQINLYREKNNSRGFRWKWLEELLIAKKANSGAKIDNCIM